MSDSVKYADLKNLTDREIQILLREVDQKDLVIALTMTSKELKKRILGNMTERVGTFIQDEMEFLGPIPADEVEEVQQRIVQQVLQLAEKGQVSWPPVKRKAKKRKARPSKKYLTQKETTKETFQRPLAELENKEIDLLFGNLAEIARREGILALEEIVSEADGGFAASGLRLAVDGTEPDLIMDILETWMKSLMHEHKCKYQKVIEGIMAIQAGNNPRIVEHKLSVIY